MTGLFPLTLTALHSAHYTPHYTPKLYVTSRSEQVSGIGFHPHDKSDKSDGGFLGPPLCIKKVDPEIYVSFGSYELLVRNVAHQMYEKLMI